MNRRKSIQARRQAAAKRKTSPAERAAMPKRAVDAAGVVANLRNLIALHIAVVTRRVNENGAGIAKDAILAALGPNAATLQQYIEAGKAITQTPPAEVSVPVEEEPKPAPVVEAPAETPVVAPEPSPAPEATAAQ